MNLEDMLNDDFSSSYETTVPKIITPIKPVKVDVVKQPQGGRSGLNSPSSVSKPSETPIKNSKKSMKANPKAILNTNPILGTVIKKQNVNELAKYNENRTQFDKFDFKSEVKLELYYGDDKMEGFNIIKNSDMMAFHYFGQEYNVVKTSSILALVYIFHNGIKNYIGFFGIAQPTLAKVIRRQILGPDFLLNIFKYKRSDKKLENMKILNLSRIVMLPSYRGIGVTKHLQIELLEKVGLIDDDILYVEISSAMLHSFDFLDAKWNKTMIGADLSFFASNNGGGTSAKGFKGDSKIVATTATYLFLNDHNKALLQRYYKAFYDIEFTFDEIAKFNTSIDTHKYTLEEMNYIKENQLPLMFLSVMNLEKLKTLKYNGDFIDSSWNQEDIDKINIRIEKEKLKKNKPKKEKAVKTKKEKAAKTKKSALKSAALLVDEINEIEQDFVIKPKKKKKMSINDILNSI